MLVLEFLKKNLTLVAIVVVVVSIYLVYLYGKKQVTLNTPIQDDTGQTRLPTTEESNQAQGLAERLNTQLNGGLFGSGLHITDDMAAFEELDGSSNVVFSLTFSDYDTKYHRHLLADIQGTPIYFNTSIIDSIVTRAGILGLT